MRPPSLPAPDPVRDHLLAARCPGEFLSRWRMTAGDDAGTEMVSAEAVQTYYAPLRAGRLLFEARIRKPHGRLRRRFLFLQAWARGGDAQRRLRAARMRKRPLRSVGPAVFELPEWSALAWMLPNGPRLRGLRSFMQRKAFARFLDRAGIPNPGPGQLSRPRLLRYVPRKRALFRWKAASGEKLYVKLFAPGGDIATAENLRALASDAEFEVPGLVFHDPRRRAVLMTTVPGVPFTQAIHDADAAKFPLVGRTLAAFHASAVEPAATWSQAEELRSLDAAAGHIATALPTLREPLGRLTGELVEGAGVHASASTRPIHANLFGDQLLVDGDRIGMVDVDDLAWGDPLFDLGRLIAHALFLDRVGVGTSGALDEALAALVAAYAEVAGEAVPAARLNHHVACSLVMRAKISALRPLPPGWCAQIDVALELARALASSPVPARLVPWS